MKGGGNTKRYNLLVLLYGIRNEYYIAPMGKPNISYAVN